MAHQITAKDVFGETRANGEKAWHGLGVELPEGLGAWEGFKRIGLDWETVLVPIVVDVTINGVTKQVKDPDNNLHVRADNFESLGIVGVGYKPISNRALAQFADALVGEDATVKLETAGSLRGGRRVFCSVKLPKTIEVVEGDMLDLFIIGSNAHDGTGAFQWYGSSIRPVCANTLSWSEHAARNMIRFQHTGDVDIKVEQARQALGILVNESAKYEQEIKSLVRKGLTKKQITKYFDAIYDQVFGKISSDWPEAEQIRRAEHKEKQVNNWLAKMDEPNQNIKGIAGTGWAAFNAFSEWSDHQSGRFLSTKESEARVHSNLFGVSHKNKQKAWSKALQLV